jgi:hypothetical protein
MVVLPQKRQPRGKKDKRKKVQGHQHFFDLVDFVLEQNRGLFDNGFEVYDAHLGRFVTRKLLLTRNIEDGQGLSRVCGCKGNAAQNGACPYCMQKSTRVGNSCRFPGKD